MSIKKGDVGFVVSRHMPRIHGKRVQFVGYQNGYPWVKGFRRDDQAFVWRTDWVKWIDEKAEALKALMGAT